MRTTAARVVNRFLDGMAWGLGFMIGMGAGAVIVLYGIDRWNIR